MAVRRPLPFEEIFYMPAPTGGWNPDANTWELPPNQAPVLDNALVRPGRVVVRGSLTNWADLSAITAPGPPLNVCGVQPVPGSTNLAIGRKAVSATAFVDPWFAPIVRPASSAALGFPTADLAIALGGTTLTNTATAINLIPGPRGINFEGQRYYIGYSTGVAAVPDSSGTYVVKATNLCTLSPAGTPAALTNAPTGFLDIKGYQSRIWGLGGIDNPAGGTTFSPLTLFFTNPIGPGGGNTAGFADWKDPVFATTNKIVMDGDTTDPGIGLAVVRNGLLIFRKQSIWLLKGSTSASYALLPVTRQVGCVDPRSIVETDKGVYFMSAQGLMMTDGVSVRNVSGTVLYTLQNAVTVVTGAIMSSFGGYVTSTIASGGQLIISMGIASVTSGAPDGHLQPVWSGMFDPNTNAWTRVTSSLFASDAVIITSGNNYPGQVFSTPDQRVLSIGDKYITQWEAPAASTTLSTIPSTVQAPTTAVTVAGTGTPWINPSSAEVLDGAVATAALPATAVGAFGGSAVQSVSGAIAWGNVSRAVGPPDTLEANVTLSSGQVSEVIQVSGYGFSIPAGAIIDGIGITIFSRQTVAAVIAENDVVLLKAGSAVGTNHAGTFLPVGISPTDHGSSTDLWGTTWTPADINNAGFGVAYQVISTAGVASTALLDTIEVVVNYHLSTNTTNVLQTGSYGFAIPATSTITGVQATVVRSSNRARPGGVRDQTIQLTKAGTATGGNKAVPVIWPTVLTAASYGGSGDLWGTTWTPADVNNAGFGVAVQATNTPDDNSDTASVDTIQLTVYYTVASVTHQQSFVKMPALYDTDAAGNFQPIPFRWLGQLFPLIGTSTGRRKIGQLKRLIFDYVFQGIGLPSANGFTVRPVDVSNNLISGAASIQLAPTNNSMLNSSISGGQPNASIAIERQSADLNSEATDMAFDVTWTDAQQSSQPSYVAAEIYGVGIQWLPGRDLR